MTFEASWNDRDDVCKNAGEFVQFHCRRPRRCQSSLVSDLNDLIASIFGQFSLQNLCFVALNRYTRALRVSFAGFYTQDEPDFRIQLRRDTIVFISEESPQSLVAL